MTASVYYVSGEIDYADHGTGARTRVDGICFDHLVTPGEVEKFGPHYSQRWFQNEFEIDNQTRGNQEVLMVMVSKKCICEPM